MVLPVSKVQILVTKKTFTLTPGPDYLLARRSDFFCGCAVQVLGCCSKQCRGTGTSHLRDNACAVPNDSGRWGPRMQKGSRRAHASAGMLGARHGKKSEFGACVFVGGGGRSTHGHDQKKSTAAGQPCLVGKIFRFWLL